MTGLVPNAYTYFKCHKVIAHRFVQKKKVSANCVYRKIIITRLSSIERYILTTSFASMNSHISMANLIQHCYIVVHLHIIRSVRGLHILTVFYSKAHISTYLVQPSGMDNVILTINGIHIIFSNRFLSCIFRLLKNYIESFWVIYKIKLMCQQKNTKIDRL